MPRPIFDNLNDYLRPARAEYREEIRSLAAEAIAECEGDREAIEEWMHQTIDGHEWVIYPYKAQFVALVCDCDAWDAAEDYGPEVASRPELVAYYAMTYDARAEVERQLAEREVA